MIYLGNCLDILPELEGNSYDLIYCDLPFGTTNCKWDNIIDFTLMWEQCKRLSKINTPIVFHAAQPFTSALIMSNPKFYKYNWVWEKSKATGFLNSKIRPLVAHEDLVVFCFKGKPNYYPIKTLGKSYNKGRRKEQTENDIYGKFNSVTVKSNGLRYPRTVQYFKTAESEGKTFHKTQKPYDLVKYIIETYTKEGGKVLDFTAGSGTVGKVCNDINREFTLIEKDPIIFKTLQDRLQDA